MREISRRWCSFCKRREIPHRAGESHPCAVFGGSSFVFSFFPLAFVTYLSSHVQCTLTNYREQHLADQRRWRGAAPPPPPGKLGQRGQANNRRVEGPVLSLHCCSSRCKQRVRWGLRWPGPCRLWMCGDVLERLFGVHRNVEGHLANNQACTINTSLAGIKTGLESLNSVTDTGSYSHIKSYLLRFLFNFLNS
jgi:hypothetical protein